MTSERALQLQDLRLTLRLYEARYRTKTAAVIAAIENGTRVEVPHTAALVWARLARELERLEAEDRLGGEAA